jgi:hypothetical protein
MLKPDHAQAGLRGLAVAIIMAAPLERVLLKWNQFVRHTQFAPFGGKRQAVYAKKEMTLPHQIRAAQTLSTAAPSA